MGEGRGWGGGVRKKMRKIEKGDERKAGRRRERVKKEIKMKGTGGK